MPERMLDGEEFGPWLGRQLRREGMSQADLASRLGLTRAAVSAWITGRAQPRPETLHELAAILSTDIATVSQRTTDAVAPRSVGWYHRPAHADGGREFGNAAAFAFDADLGVLAREVTQNSLDERLVDSGHPVRVRFTLHELTGEHLQSFLIALKWQDLAEHYAVAARSDQKVGRVLTQGLRELEETRSLLLLRVDDYNASGLTGPEYDDGRFSAVVRRQLDSNKSNSRAGGSYGLGKATLWATSRLGLVLINSTLSVPHEGRTERRVIGRLELPWREVDGQAYAGPAWLGEPDTTKEYEQVSRSWWAESIEVEALRLDREGPAPGTSFLVVGAHDAAAVEVDDETLQKLHDKLWNTLADHFWASMTGGRSAPALLDASVRTLRNGEVLIPESRVVPDRRRPALTRALRAYLDGETVAQLTSIDQVAQIAVPLSIPPLRGESASAPTPSVHHDAVLLVTAASDADGPQNRVVCMRGSRMTVMERSPRDVGLGADPYQAVLLAGYATGREADDVAAAEKFLRASEPPEHNHWGRTDELAATYARGALRRLDLFRAATDEALRKLVGRRQASSDDRGPEALRNGLRLGSGAQRSRGRRSQGYPMVDDIDGEINSVGAWSLRVRLSLPAQDDSWRLLPLARFDVRSGSKPALAWAELTATENCRIESGILVVEPGVRSAAFSGVTAVESHPVAAAMAGVTVELQKATAGAATA